MVLLFESVKMKIAFSDLFGMSVLVRVQAVTKIPVPAGTSCIFVQLGAFFHYNIKFQVAAYHSLYMETVNGQN